METVKTIVPIDLEGLKALSEKGKENPTAVRTLKCKTVQTDKFRHENYVRDHKLEASKQVTQLLSGKTTSFFSQTAKTE